MLYQRLLNKDERPSEEEIAKTIGGKSSLWLEMHRFIEESYDVAPELVFFTRKYGWTIRYRKSGKTLCSLFPEERGFTFHIVLGKKEAEKFEILREDWSPKIRDLFDNTKQLHDGRWLWINQPEVGSLSDLERLLVIKRKPKKKTS